MMTRAKVNYAEILNAIEKLKIQGKKITVSEIRKALGGGIHLSTITPLIERWKMDSSHSSHIQQRQIHFSNISMTKKSNETLKKS